MPNIDMLSYHKRSTRKINYNTEPRPATVPRFVLEGRVDSLRNIDIELIYRLHMYDRVITAAAQNADELNNQLYLLSNFALLAQTLTKNTFYGVKNTAIRAGYHFIMGKAKIVCSPVVLLPYLGPKLWGCVEYLAGSLKDQLIKHTGEYKTIMPSIDNKAFEDLYQVAHERYLMDMGAYGYMSKLFKIVPKTVQKKIRDEFTPTISSPQQDKAQEIIDKTKKDILNFLHFTLPVNLDQIGIDLQEGYKTAKDGAQAAWYAKSSNTLGGALPTALLRELLATYDEFEPCLKHLFEMAKLYSEKLSQSLTDGYYQRNNFDVDSIYAYVPQFATAQASIQSVMPIVVLLKQLLGTCEMLEKIDKPYGSEWEANNGKSRWGPTRGYLQLRYE